MNPIRFDPLFLRSLTACLLLSLSVPGLAMAGKAFTVADRDVDVPLVVSPEDALGVARAAADFREDIGRVTGRVPDLLEKPPSSGTAILVGTLGHSTFIDRLVSEKKLDVSGVEGVWEAFVIDVVENPLPGLERALVIAGADRRGTIFGMYSLSEEFGVSPWYWWADVPVRKRDSLTVKDNRRVEAPVVQYRGIFLNDEAPALSNWAREKFGGINAKMYVHVFELLLRLRANFLWPAMWDNAFYDDDPMSPVLAHEYGIVMSTSHHEPMMRAHKEWSRYGSGDWNYATNGDVLREFWREAVAERKDFESVVTLAMRGDGDEAMSEETNVALLEQIVADQREILIEETGRPLEEIPQVWALYKEVQEYYDRGMRVPNDVILLWCDDNWGNIRRLPTPEERQRSGGAGVYYHFDYVGGPRSYKWVNVQPLPKIWEQMHLAWKHEANRIWVVNVGDLKPMEYPIDFFLEMAWDPARMPYDRVLSFGQEWATDLFGEEHAEAIAELLDGYVRLNRQRTPEMLEPDTYRFTNYNEAERVASEWSQLAAKAEAVGEALPADAQSSFFQLVTYPVKAGAVVRDIHMAAGRNQLYALQGRIDANDEAAEVRRLFDLDNALVREYHDLNDGKWNHMMDQINLGYTYWHQPPIEVMPAVQEVRPNAGAVPGLAVDGSETGWPVWGVPGPRLPEFDRYAKGTSWFELFNRGDTPYDFTATPSVPWLRLSSASGTVTESTRVRVDMDWHNVPAGRHLPEIQISAGHERFVIEVPVFNPSEPDPTMTEGYVESDGHIAMEALRYSRSTAVDGLSWLDLPQHGPYAGGVTLQPVTSPALEPDPATGQYPASLEYDFYSFSAGEARLIFHLAPSLDIQGGEGLRFAWSIDNGPVQVLPVGTWESDRTWEQAVGDGVRKVIANVNITDPGQHTLKIWAVTPAVVFQRMVLDFGGLRPSYLGPPESPHFVENTGY